MNLVKEINFERKSITEKFAYYCICPDDDETIDTLNAELAENFKASDFQVMEIQLEDETASEKVIGYIVVFKTSIFEYTVLKKAFNLLNLTFGDAEDLLE